MNISDYIILGMFFILAFTNKAGHAAMIILAGYMIYFAVILPLPGEYYYHATALLNLVVGCALLPRYKLVALLSFTLILVNNIGFVMYEIGEEPTLYNNLSLLIILIQILLLFLRVTLDGLHIRGTRGRALLCIVNLDSFQSSFETLPKKSGEDQE